MVCDICGKTMYWCLGHAPYRVEVPVTQSAVQDHNEQEQR